MIRNGRTPTIVLIALILIILTLCYNNWNLSQRNIYLRETLIAKDEKLNDLMEKKAFVEKQIGINSDRMKYFEERIEANKQIAQQKDSDIDDLNSKLNIKNTENDKLTLELNEAKEALNLCKLEKNKEIELIKNKEQVQYQEELNKLMSQKTVVNCNSTLDKFKDDIRKSFMSQLSETDYSKFIAILNSENKILTNNSSKKLEEKKNQEIEMPVVQNVCQLSKLEGNCSQSIERYYYDQISKHCLVFVYSGCNGNGNNFETLENCQNACSLRITEKVVPQTQIGAKTMYKIN